MWIDCSTDQLKNGNCSMNVYQVIWLEENENIQWGWKEFFQDLVYGLTWFIGTVVFISIIVSGAMLIFSAWDEKLAEKWKTGLRYSIIGLFLVLTSYSIIKLIQLILKG